MCIRDSFRGLESYWEIPADAETAVAGQWREAPGDELFQALRAEFGRLPLVAEDLGIITPAVEALRDKHGLPGMKAVSYTHLDVYKRQSLPQQNGVSDDLFAGCSRWRRASAAEFGVRHQKNRSSRMPGHSGPVRAL